MEWAEENVIGFIELFKRKETIWNPKHPMYFNKIQKTRCMGVTWKKTNRPVDECKKKIENLLPSLRREKTKLRKSSGTGKGGTSN
jgi:hypothetical protein